jgi:hypothetical protein
LYAQPPEEERVVDKQYSTKGEGSEVEQRATKFRLAPLGIKLCKTQAYSIERSVLVRK